MPKRRTAAFCSTKCRVYFNRGSKVVPKVDKGIIEKPVEPIPERDINRVTGEVYEDKSDKIDSLREMIARVDEKYEAPLEPQARVEIPQYPVYESSPFPGVSRPYIPRPNVPQPSKREVYFEEGDKVELIYEDNPL